MLSTNVLVVIGSGGMGLPIARRLGVGRQVLLADFSADNLSTAEKALLDEGYSVHTAHLDVANFTSVSELAQKAATLGNVETIIHAAGVGPSAGSARRVYEIDLLGTVNVIEAFLPVVQAGSNLVCISSMAGHLCPPLDPEFERHLATAPREQVLVHESLNIDEPGPQAAAAAYGLSKRGNIVRVQASAGAWGLKGARINSVSPGVISTELGRQEMAGPAGKFVKSSPAGRAGSPEDIVNAVSFLVNPASCFITGADILVDGGAASSVRWMKR
ncbi:short-chain dehydrogenase reductase sdr [Colletotrichum karsti]|uniref:Short-chain dehydrogenase reductase sdr n=1 Tax=Colletotrichum karsti TaxID=1095194 RepID=A0A9P6I655_9PEZI|nr:short-chain dehydrogenase reductase sdr [Colletotrichum karsti]KAF9878003.1 short-chain dehydrogenase reductase sdr [Colletotrichum karsti]